uniref:ubiquitinyl hydrolase 1 n=1 Tax=Ananas comosus var. bracteatus TaxID=296719 RepID=A0A6V7Q1A2_ANACO|nr:unnamed protein product [Ananas comosus var. bracteatus]
MAPSLNGLCSFEIRINEEEEERMKRLPRWVRNSHQSAVEELERMRHDPAVEIREKFSSLAAEYEFSYSDIVEKIELLGDDYDSFRQIRRDGNNFYRSFIFSYLVIAEHLMGKHLLPDANKLYRVLSILEKYKQMNAALGGRRDTFDYLLQEFKCVLANVICGPPRDVSAEKYLRDCLDEQNELNGIILLRLITSVEIHSQIDHYSPTIVAFTSASIKEFVVEKANVLNILKDLIRAKALSNALDVPMHVVQLDAPPLGAITEGLRVHMFNCSSSRRGREVASRITS